MPTSVYLGGEVTVLGTSKVTISTATTTSFDFGTPDDLDLRALLTSGKLQHEDRLLIVFRATTSGTTNAVSFVVQDAPDNGSGAIGTPATALTDGTLTGGTGDQTAVTGVRLQPDRPWLRCRVTSNGTTDTFVASVVVLAVRRTA